MNTIDYSDLIDRLRALSRYAHDDRSIGDEAADEIERLTAERDSLSLAYKTSEDDVFNLTQKVIPNLRAERDALQAKLDALMLEYCPDEMSKEQIAEWGKHQKPWRQQNG